MIRETIAYLLDLLGHPEKILKVIKDEIIKLKEKFGDARRTKVFKSKVGEFTDEQLIPNEETIITMTETGYIKRVPRSSFKLQERGGKGVIGMTTKDEDAIGKLVSAHTHDNLLFSQIGARCIRYASGTSPKEAANPKVRRSSILSIRKVLKK